MAHPYEFRSTGWQALTGTFHRRDKVTANATPATAGTWTFTIAGQTASGLAFDITAAALQTALEALSNVAPGDVTVTMLAGANLGAANAVAEIVWGGAFANTNPTTSANFGGLTGNPHVLSTVVRQTIALTSGPGLTVKGARLMIANTSTLEALANHVNVSYGITDGTNQRAVSYHGEDGFVATSAQCFRFADNAALLNIPTSTVGVSIGRCRIASLGTDQIAVDWFVIPTAGLRARATFLMGSVMTCKVVTVTTSNANNTAVNSPSLGFQADGGIVLSAGGLAFGDGASGVDAMLSVGAFGRLPSLTQWSTAVCAEDKRTATSSGTLIQSTRIASKLASNAGVITADTEAELTAIGSDTLEITTRVAGVSMDLAILAYSIGGKKVFCATPLLPTATVGIISTSVPAFRPFFVLFAASRTGTVGTINSGAGSSCFGLGDFNDNASDGPGAVAFFVRDNQTTPSDAGQVVSDQFALICPLLGGGFDYRGGSLIGGLAFTPLGFDVDIETASAANRPVAYQVVEHPTIEGTIGLRVRAPAVDSSGTHTAPTGVTGTIGLAVEAPALTLAGAETITGTIGLAAEAPALTLAGQERFTGVVGLAAEAPALTLAGSERFTGTIELAARAPELTLAGSSVSPPVSGTMGLALEAPALTSSGSSLVPPVTGTMGLAVEAPALTLAGSERFTGTIELAAQAPALTAAGEQIQVGVQMPAPAQLPLVLPAPSLILEGLRTPSPVLLALVLPAPTLFLEDNESPAPVELALLVPAVERLLTLLPAAVELELVVPSPQVGALIGVELQAVIARSVTLRAETPRVLELAAVLE